MNANEREYRVVDSLEPFPLFCRQRAGNTNALGGPFLLASIRVHSRLTRITRGTGASGALDPNLQLDSGKIYRLDDSGITARPYFGTECSFFQGQAIRVYASAPNSVLHHTLDGSDPTENSPPIVSGATVTATNGTILKIRAFSAARPPSEIRSIAFDAAEILAPELTGVGDTLQFAWFGARSRTYEVQASEKLSFWITIRANLLGSDATIRITEPMNRSPNSLRFYRVVKSAKDHQHLSACLSRSNAHSLT